MKKQLLLSIVLLISASTFISAEYEPSFIEKRFYNPKFIIESTDEYGKTTEYDIRKIAQLLSVCCAACYAHDQPTPANILFCARLAMGISMFYLDWKGAFGDAFFFVIPALLVSSCFKKESYQIAIPELGRYVASSLYTGNILPVSFSDGEPEYQQETREITL